MERSVQVATLNDSRDDTSSGHVVDELSKGQFENRVILSNPWKTRERGMGVWDQLKVILSLARKTRWVYLRKFVHMFVGENEVVKYV